MSLSGSMFPALASSSSLATAFWANSASRSDAAALRAAKKTSCASLNRRHRASSASRAHARPPSTRRAGHGTRLRSDPSRWSRQCLGLRDEFFLRVFAVARSRSSSAKWVPRRRLNASLAFENRFHSASSVFRSSPRSVSTRRGSRADGRRRPSTVSIRSRAARPRRRALPCGPLLLTGLVLLLLRLCRGLLGAFHDRRQSRAERVDVADDGRGRQGLGECLGGRPGLLGVAPRRTRDEPRAGHLGREIVVAAAEVGEAFGGVARLPGADLSFPVSGLHPGGTVVVDAAEQARIAGAAV